MPTKTIKKPRARKLTTPLHSGEYTELRTELLRYINERHDTLHKLLLTDGKEWDVDSLVARLKEYGGLINKLRDEVEKLKTLTRLLDDRQGDAANSSRAMYLQLEQHEKDFDRINEKLTKEQVETPEAPPEKTLKECLTAAKYLVSAGWCVGKLASRSNDEEVHSHDSSATRWSALGAIVCACDSKAPMDKAVEKLYEVVRFIWPTLPMPSASLREMRCLLDEWNDGMVRGKEDVVLAFDIAIKKESLRV